MKNAEYLPLGAGMLLLCGAIIASHSMSMPVFLPEGMLLAAIALELWGVIAIARSPQMKNSKLAQWKRRLIGRESKS